MLFAITRAWSYVAAENVHCWEKSYTPVLRCATTWRIHLRLIRTKKQDSVSQYRSEKHRMEKEQCDI